jgi:hypothetical protein
LAITSVAKLYWAQDITMSFSDSNKQTYLLLKDEKLFKEEYDLIINKSLDKTQLIRDNIIIKDSLDNYL